MKIIPGTVARLSQVAVGIIFIVAAASKGTDVVRFSREIQVFLSQLEIGGSGISSILSDLTAYIVIMIEFIIGSMFLTGLRITIAAASAIILLTVFTGVTLWGSQNGLLESCGCFGTMLKRSVAGSVWENSFFMVLTVISAAKIPAVSKAKFTVMMILCSAGLILGVFSYFIPPSWAALRKGMNWPVNIVMLPDSPKDGQYVWILDPDCTHCVEATTLINRLVKDRSWKLTAVSAGSQGRIDEYVWDYEPGFKVVPTDKKTLDRSGVPSGTLIEVSDGTISELWGLNEIGAFAESK